jgi:hypothetical protein
MEMPCVLEIETAGTISPKAVCCALLRLQGYQNQDTFVRQAAYFMNSAKVGA